MKYKRVLLKLSGESLGGNEGRGIDEGMLARYAAEVAQAVRSGVQVFSEDFQVRARVLTAWAATAWVCLRL